MIKKSEFKKVQGLVSSRDRYTDLLDDMKRHGSRPTLALVDSYNSGASRHIAKVVRDDAGWINSHMRETINKVNAVLMADLARKVADYDEMIAEYLGEDE